MELHCTLSFIINLPSSWYDWNTVKKVVKSQVIHPSTVVSMQSQKQLQHVQQKSIIIIMYSTSNEYFYAWITFPESISFSFKQKKYFL